MRSPLPPCWAAGSLTRQDPRVAGVVEDDVGVLLQERRLRPFKPTPGGRRVHLALGPELNQQVVAGDPHLAILDHDVRLAPELQGRLVVLDIRHRADEHVVAGVGRPAVVTDPDVAGDLRVDHPHGGRPGLVGRQTQRLVEVHHRLVGRDCLELLLVARLPDQRERLEEELFALVPPLIFLVVHPVAAFLVVVAARQIVVGAPVPLAESFGRQGDRLLLGARVGRLKLYGVSPPPGGVLGHDREQPHVTDVRRQQHDEAERDLERFLEHDGIRRSVRGLAAAAASAASRHIAVHSSKSAGTRAIRSVTSIRPTR